MGETTLKTVSRIVAIALVVAASWCMPAQAADWSRVETAHFVITTDASARTAETYAQRIEAFRHVALMMLGADPTSTRTQGKFDIWLLRSQQQVQKLRPKFSYQVGGLYFTCEEGALAYASVQDDSDAGLMTLLHEYSHHLMFQSARGWYPAWYVEGFADYMSTASMDEGGVSLGNPHPWRVRWLSQHRWLAFERVLAPQGIYGSDKAADEEEVHSFYAQSWLLAHYMLNDSERIHRFNAYFARVGAGEDPVAAFEPATGIPVGRLKLLLKRYLEAMPVITIPNKDIPNVTAQASPLPEDTRDWLLNASLLRTCMGKAQGEQVLAQLRTQASAPAGVSPELRLARDRAEILFGDAKAARDDLTAHAAEDEGRFEAHYLLGRAAMASALGQAAEARDAFRDQAREQFLQAYRLKKVDAPNLYFLSFALTGGGTNSDVLNAARGAHALSPSVDSYAIREAQLDLDADQRDKAELALTPLASDPHDPARAARMRAAIDAIHAGKSRAEIDRAMSGEK